MKFDLNAAAIFSEVVRQGSFVGAAKSLGLPTSTVSDRISSLEKSIGVPLLARTTRKLRLTEAGERYFQKSDSALSQLQEAMEEASKSQAQPTGILRLTCPVDFPVKELAEALALYQSRYPEVKIEISFRNEVADLVKDDFDIAIRGGHLKNSSLKAKKLGSGQMVLAASSQYLKNAPAIKHPKDLSAHRCLHYQSSRFKQQEVIWPLEKASGATFKAKPSITFVANSMSNLVGLLKENCGVAYMPEMTVKAEIDRKELVRVLPEWGTKPIPVHLVYLPHRMQISKIREMIPILVEKLQPLFV